MAGAPEVSLSGYPSVREAPLDPPGAFTRLRTGPPVRMALPDGGWSWLLSRYADVRFVLGDPRFSNNDTRPGYPRTSPIAPGFLSFLRMDDPEHGRLRRTLTTEFTVRRITAMRADVERIADDLLDEMAAGPNPADLVGAYALPLPSLVICELLGVPYEDHDFFQDRSRTIVSLDVTRDQSRKALEELGDYLDRLVANKIREPSADLLSRVAARHGGPEGLSHAELVAMARLLLVAGHETTANMLSVGTLALLRHPDQLAHLRSGTVSIRAAVEELLRHQTIVQAVRRLALETVEVGGVTVRAGEGVVIALQSANRDEAAFEIPGSLNLHHPPTQHIAFGHGIHQCLGQTLARLELEIGLSRLLTRFPSLALAAEANLSYRETSLVFGVNTLPVTW